MDAEGDTLMKCEYRYSDGFQCTEEVCGGNTLCYYHRKKEQGLFDTGWLYTLRRLRALDVLMQHNEDLVHLCTIKKPHHLRMLESMQAKQEQVDLSCRIALRKQKESKHDRRI